MEGRRIVWIVPLGAGAIGRDKVRVMLKDQSFRAQIIGGHRLDDYPEGTAIWLDDKADVWAFLRFVTSINYGVVRVYDHEGTQSVDPGSLLGDE